MCLGHLTPAIEWLYTNEPCVVIGMSEFYPHIMFALKRIEDGKIFVAKISDVTFTKIQPQKTTQEQAIESFKMCIEAEIDLMYTEEWEDGFELPDDFDYDEWYEEARETVYNLPHMITLRNFIEGE